MPMYFTIMLHVGTTGLSRPLSVKTLLGRSSLSKASGAKPVSKMSGEEESLEKCAQSIVENSVSCFLVQNVSCCSPRDITVHIIFIIAPSSCL